ncbi:MAG TPA: LamG-like jellyroll fold domain-containing protein [Bryobacteraceae bacterium]
MRLHFIRVVLLLAGVAPIPLNAASGVYTPSHSTLFHLPLDGPDAGAPEGCSILNPALLSFIPDRFGKTASAIHVGGTGGPSDAFHIACTDPKITANPDANDSLTIGYWTRMAAAPASDGLGNLTMVASKAGGSGCTAKGITTIADGKWHNLVWVLDRANRILTLYVDGTQEVGSPLSDQSCKVSDSLFIAGAEDGSFALDGDLDDLWIESHAWNAADVARYFGSALPALTAGPLIDLGGVVNAASGTTPVAPGSIALVQGSFLLSTPAISTGSSWPVGLGGLSMQFGATQAPLYYASGSQVNFQVPWELAGSSSAGLTVTVGGETSPAQAVSIAQFAPGIFSMNSQGTGQGAIVDNSTGLVVDASNPASPGATYLQIYCTGLGPVTNQPPTGSPAPSSPYAETTTIPIVTIGGVAAPVLFSGLAPGGVGEYVVNVQVPPGAPAGSAVPVVISIGGVSSNSVTIALNPGAVVTGGTPNSADTIVITDESGAAQTNYPEQIGRPFVDGEIPNYPIAILNGVTPLFTQADVKNRYPDGSVKFAILSFLLPSLPAKGSVTIAFGNQLTGNNTPLIQSQMLDPGFNFEALMTLTGTSVTQSASARTMLTNGNYTYWTLGPIATTIILADNSVNAVYDMGFDAHKPIRPIFEATFWPTINKVKVRYILEDSNTLSLEDVSYSAVLTIGDMSSTTVYNSAKSWPNGVPQVGATRWTKIGWIGGAPTDLQNLDNNLAYLESTNAVPNFDTTKPVSSTVIASDYSAWLNGGTDIYQVHGSNAYTWDSEMGDTGGRLDIAPFPGWYTRWLYTGDYREREIMLGNADRAGAWPVDIREGATGKFFDLAGTVPALGRELSIAARPTLDFSQSWTQPNTRAVDKITPVGAITGINGPWQWDSAHLPDAFFLPYLSTGDYFYLEQMNFWTAFSAAYPVASTTENYGRGSSLKSGVVYMGQVRAEAWGLRERAEAAWIEPDGTPEQTLFNQWMASYIGVLDGLYDQTSSQYAGNADWNWGHTVRITNPVESYDGVHHPPIPGHTGVEWNYGANTLCGGNYGTNPTVNSCQSGFMLSYLGYALGRAYQLGFPTNYLLGNVVGPWYVAVITDPTYNPYMLLADRIPTQKVAGPAYYSSMPDILTGYWQTTAQAVAAGANVWAGLSSFPLSDPVNGYEFLGTAAIAAIKNFTPGGTDAWNWVYMEVESASNYGSTPDWALLPLQP